ILELREICTRRAKLLSGIGESVARLRTFALDEYPTPYQRWQFNAELEELRTRLFFMKDIAISRTAFESAEKEIGVLCDSLSLSSPLQQSLEQVLAILEHAVQTVSETSGVILEEGNQVITRLKRDMLARPTSRAIGRLAGGAYGLLLNKSFRDGDPRKRRYLADLADAARRALKLCDGALNDLGMASGLAAMLAPGAAPGARSAAVELAFKALADSNRDVADGFDDPIRHAARWCKTIVDREIAFASAQNITDFDPAELVSGMAVAVRYDLMSTPIQVRDAVKRALDAVWSDGSWRLGRPFFSVGALGTWPATADVLWTLTSAIERQPSVVEADAALFSYVDWLERTRRTVRRENREPATGWSADRVRQPARIHVPTTALNIHVLLEVRNMVEHRLWELCQKRFTVPREGKRLEAVFPVDLNRSHGSRLHTFLSGMARGARGFHKGGTYSLVLHGPPGSSKTVLSEALSREMWRESQRWGWREPRLIRITPADFTRLGEDRIDSEARLIFDLLSHVRSATILFDEIDDLLLRRGGEGGKRFMDLVIPAMLNRLQDLRSACPHQEICFVFGTNFVENIEPALMRKGRIDRRVAVVYPDWHTRLATIGRHLDAVARELETGIGDDRPDWERFRRWIRKWTWRLAQRTAGWPWLVLDSFCERLARDILQHRPALIQAAARPDRRSLKQFRASTVEKLLREKATLAEPAYASRLLNRFDSPELLSEYALHLLACGTGIETAKEVVKRGRAEMARFAAARLDANGQARQQQIWSTEIAGPLTEAVERELTLAQLSAVEYPRSSAAMLKSLRQDLLPHAQEPALTPS
ncbi:ATP-binding protein, partial [Longimicrobium sp.]|uniref:ATP-binding protein n=1 Tax=Longimicrobium sp. TaxID=2029185 RepID=UPI002E3678D2